jgi:hypothetical protein
MHGVACPYFLVHLCLVFRQVLIGTPLNVEFRLPASSDTNN